MWLERYDELRAMLAMELDLARAERASTRISWTLGCMALFELWQGRLQEARRLAGEALTLAEACGPGWIQLNHATLATIAAIQGHERSSRESARDAARLAARSGEAWQEASAKLAPALLALGLGRYEEVVEILRPLDEWLRPTGLAEPGMVAYHADLIEAYARLGMIEEARSLLGFFEGQGRRLNRSWVLAAAARCRGLLAEPAGIDAIFGRLPSNALARSWCTGSDCGARTGERPRVATSAPRSRHSTHSTPRRGAREPEPSYVPRASASLGESERRRSTSYRPRSSRSRRSSPRD
jgi:hypothetical protein